ncbi:hypothetical protein [Amycolatopsis sp. cmx-11-51]|uniref:hypothetical protein n=1 Tax=Amycolatopsis sp. cmx-11-51 TaxID=2785797 RepID=UPI0039E35288
MTLDEVTITGGHTRDGAGTNADGERNWGPLGIIDSVIVGNTTGSTVPGSAATATTGAGRGGGGGLASSSSGRVGLMIAGSSITGNATCAGGNATCAGGRDIYTLSDTSRWRTGPW